MITLLLIWNILLTLILGLFLYRYFRFESEVFRFANMLKAEAAGFMPRFIKISVITLIALFTLKKLTDSDNENV